MATGNYKAGANAGRDNFAVPHVATGTFKDTSGIFAKPLHQKPQWQSDLFKTTICKRWEAGRCDFGDACMFAHGESPPAHISSHLCSHLCVHVTSRASAGAEELRQSPRLSAEPEETVGEVEERRKMRAIEARAQTAERKAERKRCDVCKRFACVC